MQSVLISSSSMNKEMLDSFGNVPNRQLYKIDDELYELIIVHNGLYVSRIMVSISDILFLTMILDLV